MTTDPADDSDAGRDTLWQRATTFVPGVLRQNLTAKLLLLLLVGTLISGAVVVVSYGAINDEITDQVRSQVESGTTVRSTIYENWLSERWTTLNAMTDEPEMQHESAAVLHQWLSAKQTGVSDAIHSLHIVDIESGTILGSTNTAYHGTDLYETGLNETTTSSLLFVARQPIRLDDRGPKMTVIGTHSGDRMLVAAVPANTSLVDSQALDDAKSSLYSVEGHRLLGDGTAATMELPEGAGTETTVIDSGETVVGVHVIAHDVLNAQPVEAYDEVTTVGAVVVTQTPKSEAFAVREQITDYLAVAFGLGLLLLIGTAAISMRSVTADINRLSDRARQVSEGSFDVDVTSHRRDEIGTLYRSVGDMRDSLQERLQQVSSQKREMEAARQEAEQAREKLREIIDLVPDLVFVRNSAGEYLVANEATAEAYGLSPEEVEGKTVRQLATDKMQAERFHEDDLAVIESGKPLYIPEEEVQTTDGETRIHQTTKIPYGPVDSSEDAVLTYARDVTTLKEREQELADREEKYRNLFEDTQNALMVFTREGYLDCNQQALELFDVESVEAFIEYTPWELAPETQPDGRDSKEVALEHVETAFEAGDTLFEYTHQRADGTEFPAEVKLSRFEYEGQKVLHSLVRDITERRERERELREREAKYRNLFENTRDALMLLDRDGFFDCNEQTLELFGVESVAAFAETTPWELAPSEQPDGSASEGLAREHIEEAFETGEAFFEWIHQRVDGTEFPAEVKLSRFETGEGPALHALVRDITDRKEYERRIEKQRDNLETLNKMVRHDIRNDLQIILGYAETLDSQIDDANLEYVEQVLSSASHAIEITTTARDVSEAMLDSETALSPVHFRAALEHEIEEARASHENAIVRIDGSIPDVHVMADDLLESVFRNLLNNAITHNDKEVPRVVVSAEQRDGRVRLRIADNGPGVPDARKDVIFEEGERGIDSEGTGLGLYLVQTLVDQYGGEIWVEDRNEAASGSPSQFEGEESRGAVFVVRFRTPGA
jgi:PAS domain S-box-containing protein